MKFFKWLSALDRRFVFLLMALVVLVPMLFSIPVPFEVGEPARNAYNAIDSLPSGSVLMLSVDYDATSYPECQPMIEAVVHHAFRNDLRIILIGNIPTVLLAYGTVDEIQERVREYCVELAPGGGYVLGSSTSIMDGIPPANFVAMIEAVHKYGRYGSLGKEA